MYSFNYHVPSNIDEAIKIHDNSEDPKYLAGGMTLIASMKQRLIAPSDLIDLNKINSLKNISIENNTLKIGSLVTHDDISKNTNIKNLISGFSELSSDIGDQAVRNFGTIGGSIANADPAADWPAAVLSLKSEIKTNKRTINGNDFFLGMFETALNEDEILIQIDFEIPTLFQYIKFSNPASRYAIVGVALSKYNNEVRIGITGAAHKPFRAKEIESSLSNDFSLNNIPLKTISLDSINHDIHASQEYRIHLIDVLVKRAVQKCL